MNDKAFTSRQLEQITGMRAKTLHYYIEAGAIIPGVKDSKGSGTVRYFSAYNLMEGKIIGRLIAFGLPKRAIISMLFSLKGDSGKLDPYKISSINGDVFLHFFPDIETGKVFHSFELTNVLEHKKFLGVLDLNDYSIHPISIRINLKRFARDLLDKMEKI